MTEHEKFKELSSVQFASFEEQLVRKMQQLKGQGLGRCTVSRMGEEPQICQVPLADATNVTDEERSAFLERVYEKPCYLTPEEADRRIEARTRRLLKAGGVVKSLPSGQIEFDPETVWEEEKS